MATDPTPADLAATEDPLHPHERDGRNESPVIDKDGRCLVCCRDVADQRKKEIDQLRERLAAVEGAVSDWHCKACNTVFPDWGDKMRCSCGKGERWPSSFNQRRAERDCESAIKNANECLIAVRDSYLSMNEAKADAGKLREENGRLRAYARHKPTCNAGSPNIGGGCDCGLFDLLAPSGKADDTPAQAD